ncbi:TonB-dependent receptor plug domain-containing protein [Pelagicoccus sp. SDUM812005]|uniref:TonB-dependent siderophore receptor n=1 Tax=Pelagicoccus sp. SDUM812005 TaxID=3041257 RepID=UPI00280C72A6|nr:TonB-dependent receptor plug domain-containing protein [Pelagicoccus sp. SDUM812005]MDQ8183259.1 TonB-dependent receptor plug domain-containing protein [Pelagicoccus sp. SDUM812005]
MKNIPCLQGMALSAVLPLIPTFDLSAQSSPASPPRVDLPQTESMEVYDLDSFTVTGETDVGYVAVDALAGGRINTPVRLTPSAMSSLTSDFLQDVAVNNARDALAWTINVTPADPTGGKSSPFNAWDYNFRGAGQNLQGGSGPTRNYFTFYQVADSYNVERMEFDRGPNAILFGVGSVGGVMSTYSKIPHIDKDFFTPTIQADEHGSLRISIDGNMRIGEGNAIRVNALRDRNRGWRENDRNDTDAVTIAAKFKLSDKSTLRGEFEHSESERTVISNTYSEAVSLWDGSTVSESWGNELSTEDPQFTAGAPGVRSMHPWGGENYNLWIAGQEVLGLQDWAQGYSSQGTYLPVAPTATFYPSEMQASWQPVPHPDTSAMPVLPRSDWTLSAADSVSTPEFDVGTLWLDHRFTDQFEVSLSGYRYEDSNLAQNYESVAFLGTDLNRQLPNGEANPNFGKRYGDFFASRQMQERTVSEVRALATYRFEGRWGEIPYEQVFSLGGGVQEIEWSARQRNAQVIDDDPENWRENMVWVRLYEDTPNAAVALPDEIDGQPVAYAPLSIDWFDFDESYELRNGAFVSQTRLWEDRLNVMLGARYDEYDYERLGVHSDSRASHSADGTSYSAGAVYYIGPFGVFGNFATNFDPIGPGRAPKLDGTAHEAAEGEGVDFGIRISTADHNYYATLSRYESKSEGRITGAKIGLASIWQRYYDATGLDPVERNISLSFDDVESLEVSGYEFEVVANPIEGLRLQAGFAKPDSEIVEAMAGQRLYWANHYDTWSSATAGGTSEASELQTALRDGQNLLDQNAEGQTKIGLVDYTANVFAHYTFRDGVFGGFSVGGGATFVGEQYAGEVLDEARYRDERVSANLVLAYETQLWETPTRIALNVDNVLDDSDYVASSYDGGWLSGGRPILNGYYFPAPRTARLSVSMDF